MNSAGTELAACKTLAGDSCSGPFFAHARVQGAGAGRRASLHAIAAAKTTSIYMFLSTNERQQHATAMHTGGGIFFCKFYGVAATHATAASGSITGASSSTTGSSTTTSRFWPPRMNDSTIV